MAFTFAAGFMMFMLAVSFLGSGCRSGGGGGGGPEVEPSKIQVANVLISPSLTIDIVLDKPKARLGDALLRAGYGLPMFVAAVPDAMPENYSIVIGDSNESYIRKLYADNGLVHPSLSEDGYHLQVIKLPGKELTFVVVSGEGPRGVVYGIYELIRCLTLNLNPLWETQSITIAPAFPIRYTSAYSPPNEPHVDTLLMDPDEKLRMGYNGIVLYGLTELCTYEDYDNRFYDPSYYQVLIDLFGWPDLRGVVEADRAYIRNLLQAAKDHHLEVFLDG
ncbi:MAG: alpha-glucuronidase family glycosyl hydrolase, partial [Planctomycetota bacterium]